MRMNGGSSRECHVSRVTRGVTCDTRALCTALCTDWIIRCTSRCLMWSAGQALVMQSCSMFNYREHPHYLIMSLSHSSIQQCQLFIMHSKMSIYSPLHSTENCLTPPVLTILGSVCVLIVRWWMVVAGWPGDQALHNPPPAQSRVRIHVDTAPALV